MSFSDLMSSGRGPGVIGMLMALLVLVGFGTLFMFAFDEGAQGADVSIEATIKRQANEIDSLHRNIATATARLAQGPALSAKAKSLADLKRENLYRAGELENLRKEVASGNEQIGEITNRFEAYKDEYRAFARNKARSEELGRLETADGTVFEDVSIREVTAVGMQIRHREGFTRIPFEDLPADLQDRFQFDAEQKQKAIAEEHKSRNAHEKAVAITNAAVSAQVEQQREAEEIAKAAQRRREAAQVKERIRGIDQEVDQLSRDLVIEAQKKLSRAPQMRAKISNLRRQQATLRNDLSRLESAP